MSSKNILLLQGPMGPFLRYVARQLSKAGHQVFKVNFNGGDSLFFNRGNTIDYLSKVSEWPEFFSELLRRHSISAIYLYGDCRIYHRIAHGIATQQKIPVYVFEEGYIRPDYITFEHNGVNKLSSLSRDISNYPDCDTHNIEKPERVGNDFLQRMVYAALYYANCYLFRKRYPYYQHHRPLMPVYEGWCWLISGIRKCIYKITDKFKLIQYYNNLKGQFFLVPLQISQDAQVKFHSSYEDMYGFIRDVMISFAEYADKTDHLVIKHHPMDRGHAHYGRFIRELANDLNMLEKVLYLHEAHQPSLIKRAKGVITINSTMGLSALYHGTPVKVMGEAVYDMPGLTWQGELRQFWSSNSRVDQQLVINFRNLVIEKTQLNGSFYKRFPEFQLPTTEWALGYVEQIVGERIIIDG